MITLDYVIDGTDKRKNTAEGQKKDLRYLNSQAYTKSPRKLE